LILYHLLDSGVHGNILAFADEFNASSASKQVTSSELVSIYNLIISY